MVVEDETFTPATGRTVAQPTHALIALRAVGGHPTIVTAYPPEGVAVDLVHDGVRAGEMSGCGHLVVEDLSLEVAEFRSFAQSAYLHEAKTVIGEGRVPCHGFAISGDIIICNLRLAQIVGIEFSVGLQCFGEAEFEGIARIKAKSGLEPAHHVLAHVQDVSASGNGGDGNGFDYVLDLDVGVGLGGEFSPGLVGKFGLSP